MGEIISEPEAIRRYCIYEQKKFSYLFDVNSFWVVDSARYGNKTRFMNHSLTSNVLPRVMMVNMTHRIGFYACKDIEAGEELFFNYGPKFDAELMGNLTPHHIIVPAPGNVNKARKTTGKLGEKKRKRSVSPKQDLLDMKDMIKPHVLGLEFDINEPLPVIEESEVSEFEDDGAISRSDNEVEERRPRRKRNIRKPARYA